MNISIGKTFNLDFRDKFRKIGIQKDKINEEEEEERRRGRVRGRRRRRKVLHIDRSKRKKYKK